jgi:hypothetical protein
MKGVLIVLAALCALPVSAQEKGGPRPPTEVAASYLDAMEAADLDKAESLFARESSIFEGGGDEGTWKHYREHHIGPELAELRSFKTTRGKAEQAVSADGSMVMVAWPVDYRIELKDGKVVDSESTVTFVLVREGEAYRIRHLHWSSRKKK